MWAPNKEEKFLMETARKKFAIVPYQTRKLSHFKTCTRTCLLQSMNFISWQKQISEKNIWSQSMDLRSRVLHPKKNFQRRFLKHISKTGHSYLANFNTCGNLLSLPLKNSTTNVWPYLLRSTVIAISCNDDARHKKW